MVNFAFLPGFALNSGMYSRLDVYDAESGIEIHPGPNWNATVHEIAKDLQPKTVLVGYSLGARLALNIALDHPSLVSGLVLLSVNCGIRNNPDKEARQKRDEELSELARTDIDQFWSTFDKNDVFQISSPSDKDFITLNRKTNVEEISFELTTLGLGNMPDLEDRLIELRVPVLYIAGTLDEKYCELNSRYNKKTPFSHFRAIDSDHRVPITSPKITNLYIEWFANNVV